MTELFLTLLERFGLPIAFLALTIWVAVRLLRGKDQEIHDLRAALRESAEEVRRLHAARLTAVQDHGERLLSTAQSATETVSESHQTLTLVGGQMDEFREELREWRSLMRRR